MKPAILWCSAAACLASPVAATVINFDDRFGHPLFGQGFPVPPEYFVDDEYASLGVLFSSGGGGICVAASGNAVSPWNVAVATGPGPVGSYTHDVEATFMIGATPAIVDSVSITLTNSSQSSTLRAYGLAGSLLGQSAGGHSATLLVSFPGQIHRVVIAQGPMGFDDFTFEGLIPAPGVPALLFLSLATTRRHR